MSCRRVADDYPESLEALPLWRRLNVRFHAAYCPACKAFIRQIDETAKVLGESKEELSDEESHAMVARLRKRQS